MRKLRSKSKNRDSNEDTTVYISELPIATVLDEKPIIINGFTEIQEKIREDNKNSKEWGNKCAEIFRNNDEDFNYLCTICGTLFNRIEKFIIHISKICKTNDSVEFQTIKTDPIDFNENSNESENIPLEKYKVSNKTDKDLTKTKNKTRKRKDYRKRTHVLCNICNNKFTSKLYLDSHLKYDHVDMPPLKEIMNVQNDLSISDDYDDDDDDDDLDVKEKEKKMLIKQKKEEEKRKLIEKLNESIARDPLKCRYCEKRFRGRMQRYEHECVHTGIRPYQCNICGNTFFKKSILNSHMSTHKTIRKLFKCEICNVNFKHKPSFKKHLLYHNIERPKPFKCRYCDKKFSQGNGRKTHERTHTKEKPYQCTRCGVRFVTVSSLNKHNRMHNNLKNFKCNYCNKAYNNSYDLKYHLKIHTGEGSHICKICGGKYKTYRGLRIHMNGHTKSGYIKIENHNENHNSSSSVSLLNNVENDKNSIPSSSKFNCPTVETTNIDENDKQQSSSISSLNATPTILPQSSNNILISNSFGPFIPPF